MPEVVRQDRGRYRSSTSWRGFRIRFSSASASSYLTGLAAGRGSLTSSTPRGECVGPSDARSPEESSGCSRDRCLDGRWLGLVREAAMKEHMAPLDAVLSAPCSPP